MPDDADRSRCPHCNKDLTDTSPGYKRKHLARCGRSLNPYQYSDRKRGRPRLKSLAPSI